MDIQSIVTSDAAVIMYEVVAVCILLFLNNKIKRKVKQFDCELEEYNMKMQKEKLNQQLTNDVRR